MVQWLGLGSFTARARVQSLVGELRSHKPRGTAKTKKILEKPVAGGFGPRAVVRQPLVYVGPWSSRLQVSTFPDSSLETR